MPSMPHSVAPPQGDTAADPVILGVETPTRTCTSLRW